LNALAEAIAGLVSSLGASHLGALANAYRSEGAYSPVVAARGRAAVPAPHQAAVDRLDIAWQSQPDFTGSAVALAIHTAVATASQLRAPAIEVVVTGPDSPVAPVRLTSEVVRQLIDTATQRVTLVSYAAYRIDTVIAALDAAVDRGVHVSLILESAEVLTGGGGAHAYARYHVYCWPLDRREPPDAKLHAKAVVIDSRDVLLTSANMTQAAYDKNIELGLLCHGGTVAAQIQRHFDALITRGILQPAAV